MLDPSQGFIASLEVGGEWGFVREREFDDVDHIQLPQFVHDAPSSLSGHQSLAVCHRFRAEVGHF